jgi:uncharacterized protein (TIGR00730 family)
MDSIVTVFGSSVPGESSPEYGMAYTCGRTLAESGMTVCNGGYAGLMEASAKGAVEAGGKTVGVTVSTWSGTPNRWIQKEIRMPTLLDRMMKLVEMGDAYVVLPGGSGTLLELACVLELVNKSVIRTRPIVLVGDFWDGVLDSLRREPGVTPANDCTRFVHEVRTPEGLVAYLKSALGSA